MDDIRYKRESIKKKYPHSDTWSDKVDAMSDPQVLAVYSRLTKHAQVQVKRYKDLRKGN